MDDVATMEQRFNAMVALQNQARSLKADLFRRDHPEWPDARVKKEVRDFFLYANDSDLVKLEKLISSRGLD